MTYEFEFSKEMPVIVKIKVLTEYLEKLLVTKNTNYGNSALTAPALCPEISPFRAMLIRLGDKFNRVRTLVSKPNHNSDESLIDTFIDIAGYSLLEVIWLLDNREQVVDESPEPKSDVVEEQLKKTPGVWMPCSSGNDRVPNEPIVRLDERQVIPDNISTWLQNVEPE